MEKAQPKPTTFPLPHLADPEKWAQQKALLTTIASGSTITTADFLASLDHLYCLANDTPYPPKTKLPFGGHLISLSLDVQTHYLSVLFPYIAALALKMEAMFPEGKIPYLPKGESKVLTFTREQVAVIIAACFFCVIQKPKKGYDMLQVHFGGFYNLPTQSAWEKLRFYLGYFDQIRQGGDDLTSKITLSRIAFPGYKDLNTSFWSSSTRPLQSVHINPTGKIEDSAEALQVDFADPYIGGGIDATGDQEQILFVIYPELHVSYLVCEKMGHNEAIVVSGFQRYGMYSGYGFGLKFAGLYSDTLKSKRDGENRIPRHVVAIDATPIGFGGAELSEKMLLRELNKAFVGFIGDRKVVEHEELEVSTGKWGCGAFGGNPQVKFILQWLAASENGRKMIYYSFGDPVYASAEGILAKWKGKTVGELFVALQKYANLGTAPFGATGLFKHLLNC